MLREDPWLAEAIVPDRRAQAIETCVARQITVPVGSWKRHRALRVEDGIGLLVLEGLLIRRVGIDAESNIETALGAALLVGAAAMVLRFLLDRRAGVARISVVGDLPARPLVTVAIGLVGGLIVGMTSGGSGSLMIVLLLFVYLTIGANQLVGTDLTQAVPLTLAAAVGALAFGHVELGVTGSLVIGSVPAVLIGSLLSSSVPDRYVRPAIAFVILASGLKYIGVGTTALGWTLCAVLLGAGILWLSTAQPWRPADERIAHEQP